MNTLVTGGSGLVGKNLKNFRPEWYYISSKEIDLSAKNADSKLSKYIKENKITKIVHLAGKVGGIKDNQKHQEEFFDINTRINYNVLKSAKENGVERLIASLSTCCFPDVLPKYPFIEEDFWNGPPQEANFAYAQTKRHLHSQILAYRKSGYKYSSFCPSNLYGPHDHFNSELSHFIPSLITKIYQSKENDVLSFWGDGKALRQPLYVKDLCYVIPTLLKYHDSDIPLLICPDENLSIREMIDITLKVTNQNRKLSFNNSLQGQYRKDGSNNKFMKLLQSKNLSFRFTPFTDGVRETYDWYKEQQK